MNESMDDIIKSFPVKKCEPVDSKETILYTTNGHVYDIVLCKDGFQLKQIK